jgi:hypothetical protein
MDQAAIREKDSPNSFHPETPDEKLFCCWLAFGSSAYYPYAFVASILAALMSSLI